MTLDTIVRPGHDLQQACAGKQTVDIMQGGLLRILIHIVSGRTPETPATDVRRVVWRGTSQIYVVDLAHQPRRLAVMTRTVLAAIPYPVVDLQVSPSPWRTWPVDKRERYPTWAYSGWSMAGIVKKMRRCMLRRTEGIFGIRRRRRCRLTSKRMQWKTNAVCEVQES